jgi:SWI/SNF-related matrix-associated actin-dependent regulator of chromatin subfamily A member 5
MTGTGADGDAGGRGPPAVTPGDAPGNDANAPPASAAAAPAAPAQATPAAPSNPALATQSEAQAQAVLQQQAAMQAAMAPALQAAMANPAAMAAAFAGNPAMLQAMQAMQAVQAAQGAAAFAGMPAGFPMPQASPAAFPAAAAPAASAVAAATPAAPTGASAPPAAKAEPEPAKAEKAEPKTEAPAEAPGRDDAETEKKATAPAAIAKRGPGRPKGSKSSKASSSRLTAAAEQVNVAAAATAAGVDPETAAEIPPDVLAEALGVQPAGRRSGRKTKARVVMIDGEPVLRSNAYSMNEGEPSVFDKELGEDPEGEGEGNRTSYNFEPAKRKYNKSGKPRKPYVKRQKTEEEAATGKHNREISACIEAAVGKRAHYLSRHAKALAPFVEAKVMDKIKAQADAHVPSEKILAPIDNQPESIKAVLREYQLEGIRWMTRMFDDGCSCILADEMGLGKTLQSISFLACLHEMRGAKGPHLVICPLSVLSSWMDELQKWCPTFKVVRLHSTDENERQRLRKEVVMNVGSYDVAVTTYEMACNPTFNLTLSQKVYWRTMILDEGHKVKNEDTAAHSVLSRVHRQHTVLLTGTPVQNNLHELYAILAFLHPDVFTSARSFDDAFDLSAKEHRVDSKTLDHAHYLMKPFVLRRVKGEVEVSLPEKTETKIMCPLSPAQTFWYRRLLQRESSALTAVEAAELKKHSGGGGGEDTNASEQGAGGQNTGDARKLQSLLMQLRKCCNHPYLFAGTDVPEEGVPLDELVEASGKLAVLDRMLSRLKAAGHRVVLFSQFTSMLDILQDYLSLKGYGYARLDGSTNRVQRSIDIAAFNRPNSPMFAFLLSTRAGGLGVNLQTADTCVLFDSDWNPQVDTQAMARVHRIGQKKPVHVYRLVTAGTVEERMQQRAEKKLFLEQMVSRGSTKQSESLEGVDKRDLYGLLRFGVDAIFANDEGKAPSDEELEILMDRTPNGNERRNKLASLQSEVQHTVADFADGKASAAPISTYVMPAQIAQSDAKNKKPVSVKDIAAEFSSTILSGKRERKKTTMQIDGHTVLKANNYSLEEGESSVYARETTRKKNETKKPRAQVAGRDYGHSYTCQACWDGGDIVCCDLCPVSVHAECIGMTQSEIAKATRWGCPHHSCAECGRKSAAVGGMLFRCESCPRAFCEDHLPADAEIIGECKRFQALGQRHPAQACFIRCDADCVKWAKEKRLEEGGDEAEEAQGWTIGAKVALTDAWIEERDHEIELPCDPAGGRVKPLAHATFTDLVHFLLRVEGPKRKDGQSAQRAAAARKKKEAAAAAAGGGWRDELEAADPQPGEEITVRGARAYYTKGWEKLDEVAKRFDVDLKAVLAWNKPDLPSLTQKAFLIENTRLWLTEPPPEEDADSPAAPALDPVAERRREEEELAAAAAAAQRAGIAAAKSRVAGGGGGDDDDFRDEPTVLGRPLKGLRQKDIDPTEREAIMTEMFKRARPFLERNIEKAKQKEVERKKEDEREDEERRKQEAIRAERLLRRTEGIPVHLLSATASDFRSADRDVSLGRAPTAHAPHGGAASEETMLEMRSATLRALKRCGAVAPDGEWISAADVKVRVARAERADTVTRLRTRWDHPELGEAIGFVLAVCALDRAGKVVLKRHEKFPEAVDLAAMRLAENAEVPESASNVSDVAEKTEEKSDVDAPERGVLPAATVRVQCGEVVGRLTPGGKRGEESVAYRPSQDAPEKVIPATEFERLGGRGSTRKWRQSLRHLDENGEAVTTVGRRLKERGGRWRDAVVGRAMEIRAAEGGVETTSFSAVEITGFKPESGEHEVMYHDGNREWLYLFLQTTRWPDGVPEDLPPPSAEPGDADGDGAKGGKSGGKSGGSKSGGRGRFDPAQMARPEAPEPTVASGPPPGAQVVENGRLAYYSAEGESADSLAACLKIDFRDVMAWNRAALPGLTRHARLKPDTGLWIQEGASSAPPAPRGDGGGLVETPGARVRAEMAAPTPQTVVGGAKSLTAANVSVSDAPAEEAPEDGEKRKAEGDPEGADADAPQPKKRKKKPKPGAKPKPPEIPEEDVAAEVAASCVIRAAEVPVYFGELRGVFAPGSVAGDEAIMVEVKEPLEGAPRADKGGEATAREPARDVEMAEATNEDAPSTNPEEAPSTNPEEAPSTNPEEAPSTTAIPLASFLERAGCSSSDIADWRSTLLFGGDDAGGEGQPFGGWAKRRGAQWGKQCVGNKLEILRADSARTLRVSKDAVHASGSTCSWRPGEVVSFDPETGEHGVAFLDGSEVSCFLFLQTMRWLLDAFEPVTGVPEVPAAGGIAIAMPPVPVACGGMRGCLLPGGKRGEELVRYAAPRAAATPGVLAEYVVPATEFERLGGKGTAKKWRQSLRLVAPGTHRQAETMGKWFRAYGAQTGDGSVGRHVEIFWPGDAAFYGGVIAAYKTETGEHELFYDDGGKETLQLSMQTVRWGPPPAPGARARVEKEAAAYALANPPGSKSKKKGASSGRAGGGSNPRADANGGGAKASGGGGADDTDAWIACDSCGKWRVVPKTVVAALGDNERWECKQNPRAAFNACDIPEEAWEGDGK